MITINILSDAQLVHVVGANVANVKVMQVVETAGLLFRNPGRVPRLVEGEYGGGKDGGGIGGVVSFLAHAKKGQILEGPFGQYVRDLAHGDGRLASFEQVR